MITLVVGAMSALCQKQTFEATGFLQSTGGKTTGA
jgi:hypothetical protein